MPFNPKDFLKVSQEFKDSTPEEKVRTMVNRAYYAAFGIARKKTGIKDRYNAHMKVIEALNDSNILDYNNAGKTLEQLLKLRKRADYDYDQTMRLTGYSNVILDAKTVIELLEKPSTTTLY